MESIKNAKFSILNRIEMGKLVGGTNVTSGTDRGQRTLPDGSTVRWSADCKTMDGDRLISLETYKYSEDSVAGWTSPCK